ncbi:hypothetical protein KSP40_PGU017427 [Platanthera guangdongensis]|uniref:Uncharacterized protein n=1 Tax=Platanthera guangdongensis TaxID=2320717 RepID=A0ABR2MJZ3_9ASPA
MDGESRVCKENQKRLNEIGKRRWKNYRSRTPTGQSSSSSGKKSGSYRWCVGFLVGRRRRLREDAAVASMLGRDDLQVDEGGASDFSLGKRSGRCSDCARGRWLSLRKKLGVGISPMRRTCAAESRKNRDVEKKRRQIEQQNNDRIKLASINKELETQIQDMKVKISSAECTRCLNSNYEDEIGTLKAHIIAGKEEIKSLKDFLEKERRKSDCERKRFESEKSKATENLKLLTNEKKKGEECIRLLVSEKKKVEDIQISLEKSKIEAKEMREKLSAEIAKAHDEKKQIELKAYGEKKRSESERKKIEEQKMLIEEERKKAIDIKSHTDHLTQILDEERRKREEVQKKLEDVSAISTSWDRERNVFKTLKAAELKHLKERLKLQRKRVKHAERVAKQEKSEKMLWCRKLIS